MSHTRVSRVLRGAHAATLALLVLSGPAAAQVPDVQWIDKDALRARAQEIDRLAASLEVLVSSPVDEGERKELLARVRKLQEASAALQAGLGRALAYVPDRPPLAIDPALAVELAPSRGVPSHEIDSLVFRCQKATGDEARLADIQRTLSGQTLAVHTVGLLLGTIASEDKRLEAAMMLLPEILDRGYAHKLLDAFPTPAVRARLEAAIAALPPDGVAPVEAPILKP
jgi:hypothetical protein